LYEYTGSNPVINIDPVGSFYIGGHKKISKKVYSESGLTFRSRTPSILWEWVHFVSTTDIFYAGEDYHCQDVSFVNKVEYLMGKIKNEKCPDANPHGAGVSNVLTYMGIMSHILQDCMSHTDWVEGNNEDMRKWYKKVETEKVTIWIPPSVVSITWFRYSQSIRDKAKEFYISSAGHSPHDTGLDLTQLELGSVSEASDLLYFKGTGCPGFRSLHNLFATDSAGHGRDKTERRSTGTPRRRPRVAGSFGRQKL
jgi:hypothetical protein